MQREKRKFCQWVQEKSLINLDTVKWLTSCPTPAPPSSSVHHENQNKRLTFWFWSQDKIQVLLALGPWILVSRPVSSSVKGDGNGTSLTVRLWRVNEVICTHKRTWNNVWNVVSTQEMPAGITINAPTGTTHLPYRTHRAQSVIGYRTLVKALSGPQFLHLHTVLPNRVCLLSWWSTSSPRYNRHAPNFAFHHGFFKLILFIFNF